VPTCRPRANPQNPGLIGAKLPVTKPEYAPCYSYLPNKEKVLPKSTSKSHINKPITYKLNN
jgi:hypothetical protein